jgi:integrase/recombinase XerD
LVGLNQRDSLVEKYSRHLETSTDACLSSINQARTAIDNFYQFLGFGPSSIERAKNPQKSVRVLSPKEKESLLQALESRASKKERAMVMLFLFTGIRLNECTALNVEDVSVTAHTGKLIVRKGRNGDYRELLLEDLTKKAVLAWLIDRSERFEHTKDEALFLNSHGQRISNSGADLIVRKIGIQARFVLSAQVLRDTFLAELAHKSKDIFLVAAAGGCKRLDSARRYFEVDSAILLS